MTRPRPDQMLRLNIGRKQSMGPGHPLQPSTPSQRTNSHRKSDNRKNERAKPKPGSRSSERRLGRRPRPVDRYVTRLQGRAIQHVGRVLVATIFEHFAETETELRGNLESNCKLVSTRCLFRSRQASACHY